MESLIPAGAHLGVFAALLAIAAAASLLEKTRWGAPLTGAVWAILIAILLSNLRIIPRAAPAYDAVFDYLVPVLLPLFLFDADLRRIVGETGRMLGAFGLACLGTVLGALAAALLLDLGASEAALAGIFTATYTGGSVNFAALVESTGVRDAADGAALVSASTAVDNLFSALFLALLAVAPAWAWLARRFPAADFSAAETQTEAQAQGPITAGSLCCALAAAAGIAAVSTWIAGALGIGAYRYLVITVLAVGLATAAPGLMRCLRGAFELGLVFAYLFFAAIAAGADVPALVSSAPILALFVLILLSVHALVLFAGGALLRIPLPELVTASNAAILGATTAPALAAVKGWRALVTPGVLVGVLGYAVGTFLGVAVAQIAGALP